MVLDGDEIDEQESGEESIEEIGRKKDTDNGLNKDLNKDLERELNKESTVGSIEDLKENLDENLSRRSAKGLDRELNGRLKKRLNKGLNKDLFEDSIEPLNEAKKLNKQDEPGELGRSSGSDSGMEVEEDKGHDTRGSGKDNGLFLDDKRISVRQKARIDKLKEQTLEERLEALEMKGIEAEETAVQLPSASSLASVLVQALQLNDKVLLDSCLNCGDSETVLETVKRLESPKAVELLKRIAERLSRRPGKVAVLNVWIRWTIIVHGGHLVAVINKEDVLSTLNNIVTGSYENTFVFTNSTTTPCIGIAEIACTSWSFRYDKCTNQIKEGV